MARHSLRLRLIAMLVPAILLVWLIVLLLVYLAAKHEIEEVFDADLARNARILQTLLLHEVEEEKEIELKVHKVMEEIGSEGIASYPYLATLLDEYLVEAGKEQIELAEAARGAGRQYTSGPVFIARYRDGTVMMRDASVPDIPLSADGYVDIQQGGQAWRTFSLTEKMSGLVVQVAEDLVIRRELVGYITRNTLTPLLLALPIIGIIIWAVVGQALSSLQRVARSVSMRTPDAIEPINAEGAPSEIESLLIALNDLFRRVGAAIKRERQFTADAAHELRTPLAALKTHLQVARTQSSEAKTQHSLDQALDGVDRATHSVEQLLLLARADAAQARAMVNAPVNLRDIVVQVVSAFSQQAIDRDIDLGVEVPGDILVPGDAAALQMMLRNLVDNAVRYTPSGGEVTVSIGAKDNSRWIEVMDNGVGVAVDERENILHRFHRGEREQAMGATGSGLGLSIVQRIADLHGARIQITDGLNGQGLSVKVIFTHI